MSHCDTSKLAVQALMPIFPSARWLEPEEFEFEVSERMSEQVSIARCSLRFKKLGQESSFPNKPLVESNGDAVYPEFAILNQLRTAGFDGVWVDSFRHGKFWKAMSQECALAEEAREAYEAYEEIRRAKEGRLGGCWDVLAWKQGAFVFIESKQKTASCKDAINRNQATWLESAMKAGFAPSCFAVFEWDELTERD